jgi:ATP-dependent Zn protease
VFPGEILNWGVLGRKILDRIAKTLIEKEVLEGDEFESFFDKKSKSK